MARRLRARLPESIRVLEHEGEPLELIEAWSGAREAVVVDAVRSGAPPGTIHRLDPGRERIPAELARGSTHALGLAEAVELGAALGRLPPRLLVYGIEGASFGAGRGLTPRVEQAVEQLVAELSEALEASTASGSS